MKTSQYIARSSVNHYDVMLELDVNKFTSVVDEIASFDELISRSQMRLKVDGDTSIASYGVQNIEYAGSHDILDVFVEVSIAVNVFNDDCEDPISAGIMTLNVELQIKFSVNGDDDNYEIVRVRNPVIVNRRYYGEISDLAFDSKKIEAAFRHSACFKRRYHK